jgi:hypothetical protein
MIDPVLEKAIPFAPATRAHNWNSAAEPRQFERLTLGWARQDVTGYRGPVKEHTRSSFILPPSTVIPKPFSPDRIVYATRRIVLKAQQTTLTRQRSRPHKPDAPAKPSTQP